MQITVNLERRNPILGEISNLCDYDINAILIYGCRQNDQTDIAMSDFVLLLKINNWVKKLASIVIGRFVSTSAVPAPLCQRRKVDTNATCFDKSHSEMLFNVSANGQIGRVFDDRFTEVCTVFANRHVHQWIYLLIDSFANDNFTFTETSTP